MTQYMWSGKLEEKMRKIKFRAWDILDKEMSLIDTVLYFDKSGNISKTRNFELMQFTGLKDNDGKEIYEGDIMYVMGTGNCPVKFYEGSFVLWEGYNAWTSFLDDFEGDISMKVLGNIYENPELLSDVNVALDDGGQSGN